MIADWLVVVLQVASSGTQASLPCKATSQPMQAASLVLRRELTKRDLNGTIVVGDIDAPTIRLALDVLPMRPERIVVVSDADLPSRLRQAVSGMDAFVPVGTRNIYLRRDGPTVRDAEFTGGESILLLSLVIWHEMAHVDGCGEREAQRRELELLRSLVQAGHIDPTMGLTDRQPGHEDRQ